jgi:hypothetical protein
MLLQSPFVRTRPWSRLLLPEVVALCALVIAACGGSPGRPRFPSAIAKDPRAPAEQVALTWLDACDQGDYDKLVAMSDAMLRPRLRQADMVKRPDHPAHQIELVEGQEPEVTVVIGYRDTANGQPIRVQVQETNGRWLVTDPACPIGK